MIRLLDKRMTVFCGNFGSGKTELSIQSALASVKTEKTVLCDMDIVNPYFRSSEKSEMLEAAGVRVISPTFAHTNVDVPALSPEIQSVFLTEEKVIFDVGGDDAGAVALGTYADKIGAEDYAMYMVVNAYRPMTSTPEDIAEMARRIMVRAKLRISGIINNSNLGRSTTEQDVVNTVKTVEQAASLLGVPVVAVTVEEGVGDESKLANRIPIHTVMKPEWLV